MNSDTQALHRIWVVDRECHSFSPSGVLPIDGTVTFFECPLRQLSTPHDDALVLNLEVGGHLIWKILINNGSITDLLYLPTVIRLGYQPDILQNPSRILIGFNGTQTTSLGEVVLPISVGLITMLVWLTVINELFSFNVILGHTWIHAIKALPSFYHQNLSFFDPLGTKDIRGDQKATRSCFIVEHPQTDQPTK